MNQPKKPKTPKLPPRDIGSGVFYDEFDYPAFVTEDEKKEFYFRYSNEKRMTMMIKLGFEQVLHPDTKQSIRIGTKDSESDLVLVRQPIQYYLEDLKMKRDRIKGAVEEPKLPEGFEPYIPKD